MRVIVTRPQGDAHAWVQGFEAAGHQVETLPLIDIQPARDAASLQRARDAVGRNDYRALMFVSGNAVAHFFGRVDPICLPKASIAPVFAQCIATHMIAWATGPGTVQALLQAGVPADQIRAPMPAAGQFDSQTLWAQVGPSVQAGDRVLIVRGEDDIAIPEPPGALAGVGRSWLETQLGRAGAKVDTAVAYRRCAPLWGVSERLQAQAAATGSSVWIFSSSEAVRHLATGLPNQDWSKARAVATHPRIAQSVRALKFGVVCESRPVLAEMLASIESVR